MAYTFFASSFALSNLSLFIFTMSKNMPMNSRFLYLLYPGKKKLDSVVPPVNKVIENAWVIRMHKFIYLQNMLFQPSVKTRFDVNNSFTLDDRE